MLTIFLRTIILYFILVFSVRLMGKRQIGQLQVSEFIITLLLSEIASAPVTNRAIPLLHAVTSILLLLALEVIISFLLLKSNRLKRLFYGSPTILVRRGKLLQSALRDSRIELDELLSELRQKGYSDLADIEYAILEENGQLSVFPKAEKSPLTPGDLTLLPEESGIAHVCVLDGTVLSKNLALCGWDEKRLSAELKHRKLRLRDVFLLTVDDSGSVTLIQKEGRL